ncbi:alpha/beta fold hydrolase [Planotetraspora sp. A-T 1434]|uniref:thioesterase II family protein n=1 Tax=Planotetraspora sp. A-T 1434 TaxID=2979219 RepID=UPI0021BF5D28|nr:alpha/beta fold hydrolase [Planotetraspora sp. A-T 1434]MCT9930191.1 alpha/beta fold hydrolase [Planotetraspora sp. A-T 1434]
MTTLADVWIRRFHPAREGAARLVCFPHAGGSASAYYSLSAALSPHVEVLALQYPGRQDRRKEPLVTDLATLCGQAAEALRHLSPSGPDASQGLPVAFFGHSMGAIVAFEIARRFDGVTALFASGRRAPSRTRHEDVHLRADAQVMKELNALQGTESAVLMDEEMLELILPAVRADYTAIETYRYAEGPGLTCPIVALVGDADPLTTLEEARAWREHTTGPFDLRVFPGGHFFLGDHETAVRDVIRTSLRAGS